MRFLSTLLVLIAALWGGYWYVGSSLLESSLKDWLADSRADGLRVDYNKLTVQGFPNRFDTTLETIDMTHSDSGIRWRAPFFQVFALSYKPYHVLAVWPNRQSLSLAGETLDISSSEMRGSLVVKPNTDLPLERLRFEASDLVLHATNDQEIRAKRVFVATRLSPTKPTGHDLALELTNINLPDALVNRLDPGATLPEQFDGASANITLEFSAPIQRPSPEAIPPHLLAVEVHRSNVSWGHLSLSVSGRLDADAYGFATGELALHADNWRQVFDLLVAAELIDPIWEGALVPLALADGNPETLDTTLKFEGGAFYFGPLALGPAPRLN